ncbi:MAG: hypothetical protein A2Y10_06065 [Planctomycetes bacterium GWF2_41_51]|nr:MAG: hypothetical protein A2Y10_06065 [Planctomycetes bacterium GWF2_41_51]
MIRKNNNSNDLPNDNQVFPIIDEYHDCAGKKRVFQISSHQLPMGWHLIATEQQPDGCGYQIEAFSETSPYSALGQLRKKIKEAISIKYLDASMNSVTLTHGKMRGSITYDRESDSHGLLVDGRFLSMDELETILAGHEGWEFDFSINDI